MPGVFFVGSNEFRVRERESVFQTLFLLDLILIEKFRVLIQLLSRSDILNLLYRSGGGWGSYAYFYRG
jgi:hypothetical protein